jgi:hypothetical protein
MQFHGGERVPQHQLHALDHVALAGKRLLGVVAEVGALKEPPNDLAERKHAGNRAVLEPANEEALHIRLAAAHHPLREAARVSRRGHPAAMQRSAGSVSRHDLHLVAVGGFTQVDSFADFEGMVEIRLAHAEPSLAEPR